MLAKTFELIQWRPEHREDLPFKSELKKITLHHYLAEYNIQTNTKQLKGSCDTSWISH